MSDIETAMKPPRLLAAVLALLLLVPAARAADDANGIAWAKSFKEATTEAKRRKVPVVIDFWASWCGWCKVQNKEIFAKEKMIAFSAGQVYVKLDTEDGGEGSELAERYGVSGLPTIVVTDSAGSELDRIPGYVPLDDFIERLKDIIAGKGEFQTLARKADPTSRELVKIASLYLERNAIDDAIASFQRILDHDPDNRDGYTDEALYYLGQLAVAKGELDLARRHFETYLKKYPGEAQVDAVKLMLDRIKEAAPASSARPEGSSSRYETIPGIDLASLDPAARERVVERLNSEPCTCGCQDDTVARCCNEDTSCKVAPRLAQAIVDEERLPHRASR